MYSNQYLQMWFPNQPCNLIIILWNCNNHDMLLWIYLKASVNWHLQNMLFSASKAIRVLYALPCHTIMLIVTEKKDIFQMTIPILSFFGKPLVIYTNFLSHTSTFVWIRIADISHFMLTYRILKVPTRNITRCFT